MFGKLFTKFRKSSKYNIGDLVSYKVMDYMGRWYTYVGTITATRVITTEKYETKTYFVGKDWVLEENIEKILDNKN